MSTQVRPAVFFQNLLAKAVRDKVRGASFSEVKMIDTGRDSISRFKVSVGSIGRGVEMTITLRKQELEEPELLLNERVLQVMTALDLLVRASEVRK